MEMHLLLHVWLFFAFINFCGSVKVEKCMRETLNISCPAFQVIHITSAEYGRMRRGRCVGKSYHNFDCFINVTHNVRSLCAGKRRCKFEVLSELGAKYDPCTELESFLDVDYDCLNVSPITKTYCESSSLMSASNPGDSKSIHDSNGLLSSYYLRQYDGTNEDNDEHEEASHTCSLRLETKAGKQWRLSLVMFDNNYQPETHVADKCRDLFKIKEFSKKEIRVQDYINEFNNKNKNEIYNSNNVYNYSPSNNVKNKVFLAEYTVNACMADSRNPEVLYSSVGDILEIEIKQSPSEKTFLEYLIKFNNFGCETPHISNASVERISSDEIIVTCHNKHAELKKNNKINNNSDRLFQNFHLKCTRQKEGSLTSYSWSPAARRTLCIESSPMSNKWPILSPDLSSARGIFVVVMSGVTLGILIGCSLLMVTICYYKKKFNREQKRNCLSEIDYSQFLIRDKLLYDSQQPQHIQNISQPLSQQPKQLFTQQQYDEERQNYPQFLPPPVKPPSANNDSSYKVLNQDAYDQQIPQNILPPNGSLDVASLKLSKPINFNAKDCPFNANFFSNQLKNDNPIPNFTLTTQMNGDQKNLGSDPTTTDKNKKKLLDSFPNQIDHIYEIAG